MILTNCAACAAPLGLSLGKKCGRCSTRYCGPACQKQHWDGGHKELCKKIKKTGGAEQYNANKKYSEAVAVAVEECADDTKGQTCYICTQALHWKTKEGLVRMCACRGTAGVAHVSCLMEQAKILCDEGREHNLDGERWQSRWRQWDTCDLCEQSYHGVVKCALGWACWKSYVCRPEDDAIRASALLLLGLGLSRINRFGNALVVFEALADNIRRFPYDEGHDGILYDCESNIAMCYGALGRLEEALEIQRWIYDRDVASGTADTEDSFITAKQLAFTLTKLGREAEAKSFLSKRVVEAERALGSDNETVLWLRRDYAIALFDAPGHLPLSDIIKARAILEDVLSRRRRIWGAKDEVVEQDRILLDGVGMTIEDDSGYIDW